MITAKQARDLSKNPYESNGISIIDEIGAIEAKIVYAARQGQYNVTWEGHLSESARKHLHRLNYEIISSFSRNEGYHLISWKR